MVASLTFRTDRMAAATAAPYVVAIDLAEYLVAGGMPFREAHQVVGALVRSALAGDGSLADLVTAHGRLGPKAAALLEPGVAVTRRTTPGGTGAEAVAVQRSRFGDQLAAQRDRLDR
jgi:argininosuccinate lyase